MLFACLTLVVLYLSSQKILEICFPESSLQSREVISLIAPALLAFSYPFWSNSLVAEVYSLHAFFTCLIVYFLLIWKTKNDLRFLFLAAFCFGLSAGNHATVAFYLPAILFLFFIWKKNQKIKNLGITALIFLVGFSVYLYLPIRSLAEPLIDWGNPETFQNFLYQVTDRRHSEMHFWKLKEYSEENIVSQKPSVATQALGWVTKAGFVFSQLVNDLALQFTWVMVIGFIGGAVLCARKNLSLFFFLLLFAAPNAAFFVGWRAESYFPSYIVVSLFAAMFFYWFFYEKLSPPSIEATGDDNSLQSKKTTRFAAVAILTACIFWLMISNYVKADRSNSYFGETYLKKELLSLDDEAIFITEVSLFNQAYFLDVMRLRDDVAMVKSSDFLEADPASYLTERRYPELKLPDPDKYGFESREVAFEYMMEFLRENAKSRPVLFEHNWAIFRRFPIVESLLPHKNLLLKFSAQNEVFPSSSNPLEGFNEFKDWLEEELKKPGLINEPRWIQKIIYYLPSFADHFHVTGRYKEEREVLKVIYDFLGQRGEMWHLKMVDNLILDGKPKEAEIYLRKMKQVYPNKYKTFLAEGLLQNSKKNFAGAIQSYAQASKIAPDEFRPYYEKSRAVWMSGNIESARENLKVAEKNMTTLKDLKKIRNLKQLLETTR